MKNFPGFYLMGMLLIPGALPAQPDKPDSTFSRDGKVITRIGQSNSNNSVAIQANGKIIVAGNFYNGSNNDFVLVRYQSSGHIDNGFGINGKVITDLGRDEHCRSITIQPDKKIIIAGYSQTSSDADFALVRYLPDGTLDSGFGKKGKVITDVDGKNNYGCSVTLQPNGKIIEVGVSGKDLVLLRYTSSGKPDNSFGNDGVVVTDLNGELVGNSVAIQNDGKIVVAGYRWDNFMYYFFLARYEINGSPDKSFGKGGKALTYIWQAYSYYIYCGSLAIQPDGKIVVVGSVPSQTALVRYTSNGDVDSVFGVNGIRYFVGVACDDRSLIIQNKEIIVSGSYFQDFALWGFKSNGSPDNGFGTRGKVSTDFGYYDQGNSIAAQADGKIVQAGSSNNNIAVARFVEEAGFANNAPGIRIENNVVQTAYLFPNPVTDVLHIQGLSPNSIKSVSIMNADGKILHRKVILSTGYSCHVNNLRRGVYFIRIEEPNRITMMKFVKE